MTMRLAAPAVALALLVAVAPAPMQAQFKSGAQTVAVYTTVTDASGRLVTDLERDKFEVYDNGRRQEITTFANTLQPITVVMMIDRSGSMVRNFELVKQAANVFVDRLLPGDKARIGSFSDRVQVDPREFTADKNTLHEILQTELQPPGPTPLWNALGVGMTALLHQEGRRVVLVFTDGMDRPMNGGGHVTLKDVVKRSEQEDVMVYAIGLAGGMPFGGGRRGGYGGYGGRGGGMGGGGYGRRGVEEDKPDPGLQTVAAASGGGYFELTRTQDLSPTFARVVDELHRQYLLGFVPQTLDGKSHKLEVRVQGQGLTARARKSYVAAR